MTHPSLSGRRLSALLVNHNSGAWAQRCLESLQNAWQVEGGDPASLEVIVVDSGSESGESTWWRTLRRSGARVRTSPANVGYATGLNMAYEFSSGADDDIVALLNPDLHFLPGSLGHLIRHLEDHPDTGAVQPRIFLDEDQEVLLPPNELPTPRGELVEALAAKVPCIARWRANRRSRAAQDFWTTKESQLRSMLSGACLFLRRSTIEELGEVMDGRFPLYFEDADLCRELTRAGYSLRMEPASTVLHHWSRSAGPDFVGEVAARHAYSHSLYMAKHHPGTGAILMQSCTRALGRWKASTPPPAMHPLTDLGSVHESPSFELQGLPTAVAASSTNVRAWLEISLTPYWGLSAASAVYGETFRYSAKTWSWLFPGIYYVRALEHGSARYLGAWRFQKTCPARSWPLDTLPVSAGRRRLWGPTRHGERVG